MVVMPNPSGAEPGQHAAAPHDGHQRAARPRVRPRRGMTRPALGRDQRRDLAVRVRRHRPGRLPRDAWTSRPVTAIAGSAGSRSPPRDRVHVRRRGRRPARRVRGRRRLTAPSRTPAPRTRRAGASSSRSTPIPTSKAAAPAAPVTMLSSGGAGPRGHPRPPSGCSATTSRAGALVRRARLAPRRRVQHLARVPAYRSRRSGSPGRIPTRAVLSPTVAEWEFRGSLV